MKTRIKMRPKICIRCEKPYKPTTGKQLTCGPECSLANRKTHMNKWTKTYRTKLRLKILTAYGGCCACCGENQFEFLAIDHVNNDGAKHRRELQPRRITRGGDPIGTALWAIRNDFPLTLQILCHNCNLAKGFYGYCPHKNESEVT
jgi:hypothetical protein